MKELGNEVIISIHKGKFIMMLIVFFFLTLIFSTGAALCFFLDVGPKERLKLLSLFPLAGFAGYLCIRVILAGKHMKSGMIITDDIFINYVALLGKRQILISEIYCIEDYIDNQFRIKLKNENRSRFALINQLKGYDIYLTDYLISKKDLLRVAQHLRENLRN